MTAEKLKFVTDEEQIAAIDRVVAEGWRITRVECNIGNPLFGVHNSATVYFAKLVAPPYPPEPIRYDGFETVTQEWGCGLAAGRHAEELIKAQEP